MKLRLTPLNLFTAIILTAAGYLLLFRDSEGWRTRGTVGLFTLAVIGVVADLLFRSFLKELKRIWIIELVFIIFAAIVLLLLK